MGEVVAPCPASELCPMRGGVDPHTEEVGNDRRGHRRREMGECSLSVVVARNAELPQLLRKGGGVAGAAGHLPGEEPLLTSADLTDRISAAMRSKGDEMLVQWSRQPDRAVAEADLGMAVKLLHVVGAQSHNPCERLGVEDDEQAGDAQLEIDIRLVEKAPCRCPPLGVGNG